MLYAAIIIGSYLVGCINASLVVATLKGYDVKKLGTGNAGASNTTMLMGLKWGTVVGIFDILKSVAVILVARWLLPDMKWMGVVSAASCALGHIYPVFNHFKGGKGFAVFGGMCFVFDWKLTICCLALGFLLLFLTKIGLCMNFCGFVVFPIAYVIKSRDLISFGLMVLFSGFLIYKHIPNIKQLIEGIDRNFFKVFKGRGMINPRKNKKAAEAEPASQNQTEN